MKRCAGLVLGLLLIAAAARAEDPCAAPVATRSGKVQGEAQGAACVWRGLPFAAPPVGERRWRAPAPVEAWSGVRDATRFGNQCMQDGIMALDGKASHLETSEDCLYLNVWRPQRSGTFPVMVWVHGGGYYGGSGMTPWYWGDRLAEAGEVVVVTINYRLNIFGFFASPGLREEDPNHSTGGYGTLDQAAALKWVADNIAAFGGDPGNVTIFGESAGGWSICTLLATPVARGLFHRAILESGGCDMSGDLEQAYKEAEQVAAGANCPTDDLKCLRALPADRLLEQAGGEMSRMEWKPRHDGYVLRATPLQMIREGDYNRVPFMAGSNRDEFGKALKLKSKLRRVRPAAYESSLVSLFKVPPAEAKRLVELYPLAEFGGRPVEAYGRMFGADASLACPTYLGLKAAAASGPAFYYRFNYDGYALGKYLGSAHSMEIPFIFDSLDRMPASAFYHRGNMPEARELERVIQGYWVNFARGGDPNGPGLPEWPRFVPDREEMMVLDTTVGAAAAGMSERCAFWETFSREHRSSLDALREEN